MKNNVDWKCVDSELPSNMDHVLTIGKNSKGLWTSPIFATYYQGKFLSGYDYIGDRVIKTVIETKPTHWAYFDSTPEV